MVGRRVEPEGSSKAQAGDRSEGGPKNLTADASRILSWKAELEGRSETRVYGRPRGKAERWIAGANWQ